MSVTRPFDIIVVGGGPAGMMAAIRASKLKKKVLLLERNKRLGVKLLLTGKGRCNISNACDLDAFLARFSKNGPFLRDAFKAFFVAELKQFFSEQGLDFKEERQARIFPVTDSSRSVLRVLEKVLHRQGVAIAFGQRVKRLSVEDGMVKHVILQDQTKCAARAYVLAAGGASYPMTGSDGNLFGVLSQCGHPIVHLRPALVALTTRERIPERLEGLTLKNIQIKFVKKKKVHCSEIGELLFTDDGVSGPLIISWSRVIAGWFDAVDEVPIRIDLKPGVSERQLEQRLIQSFQEHPKKFVQSILSAFLPKRFILPFLEAIKIPPKKQVNQISQSQRRAIVHAFKGFVLHLTGPRSMSAAMVTKGGVSLKQINPRNMCSKIYSNLFFAGEMMDLDGDTGGFNLQAAFSTGFLAGQSAAELCDTSFSH
jgi:predicted Rossmann fold flavoprotein